MIAIGKHLILAWQMGAPAIDQINAGQIVFLRDVLGAKMLLDGERIIGADLTVASLAMTTQSWPQMRPTPDINPAAGTESA